ncbi:MAG: translocation/assembly module TamB domain-containing protein, partial [Thermodesulfobacteriota bacterium]
GEIPFAMISPYVKEIKSAAGQINIAASLKGRTQNPIVNANLTFADLKMALEHLDEEFKNLSGKIKITPQKIEIIDFRGTLDQGKFDLGGNLTLKDGIPGDFELKLNTYNLSMDIPDTMDLNFNTSLNFSGTLKELKPKESNLTGEIVLLGGQYYKDVNMNIIDAAFNKERGVAPVKKEQENSWFENIALNIHIRQRQPLSVDNNLANLIVNPDLIIQGTASNPVVTGRAQIESGTVFFQKAEFDVIKGVVDFTNPYKIEPAIEVEAATDIRTWTIFLTISGTPDDLNFELSSDPREQHADILSLIVFGKTSQEMQQASSGSSTFNPEKIISEFVTEELETTLKDATGLDKIKISQEEQDNSEFRDIHVSVGADLSRQMSVSYDINIEDGETIQRITTDYKILENLLMSGFQESDGNFGGKIKFRLEFR